ncbi:MULTISPECIES: FecR family protein [Sphingobacterium]|uniref:FecR family protein n=1 Tax=Sphingobacterium TaxID=28453 RepID=UPI0013DBF58F|nr:MULTISPECIES: FecR family protein [unclassified Sphingobacterium]
MKNINDFKVLYKKYLAGNCSNAELRVLLEALSDSKYMAALEELVANSLQQEKLSMDELNHGKQIAEQTASSIFAITQPKPKIRLFSRSYLRYAAILVLCLVPLLWYVRHFYLAPVDQDLKTTIVSPNNMERSDVPTLELSNGEIVYLDKEGLQRVEQYEVNADRDEITILEYLPKQEQIDEPQFHTIRTPKGQRLNLTLPDGSKVHLSVGSSLRYPTRFVGNRRSVELEGEALFEVVKDQAHSSFTVISDHQEVTVLGTVFNVKAYAGNKNIMTTLLEGSVRVSTASMQTVIKPGEQSVVDIVSGRIKKSTVDTDRITAWQRDYLDFDGLSVESLLDLLRCWYPVEFQLNDLGSANIKLQGGVSYDKDIWKVLGILERTGDISFVKKNDQVIKVVVK